MLLLLLGAGPQAVAAAPAGGVGDFRSVDVTLSRVDTGMRAWRPDLRVPRQGFRPVNPRRTE